MYVRPDVLSFTNHSALLTIQSCTDQRRNLLRVRILDTSLRETVLREAVDCGREDDMRPHVACLVRVDYLDIDLAVYLCLWVQGLDVLDAGIVVYLFACEHTGRLVCEDTGSGLHGGSYFA